MRAARAEIWRVVYVSRHVSCGKEPFQPSAVVTTEEPLLEHTRLPFSLSHLRRAIMFNLPTTLVLALFATSLTSAFPKALPQSSPYAQNNSSSSNSAKSCPSGTQVCGTASPPQCYSPSVHVCVNNQQLCPVKQPNFCPSDKGCYASSCPSGKGLQQVGAGSGAAPAGVSSAGNASGAGVSPGFAGALGASSGGSGGSGGPSGAANLGAGSGSSGASSLSQSPGSGSGSSSGSTTGQNNAPGNVSPPASTASGAASASSGVFRFQRLQFGVTFEFWDRFGNVWGKCKWLLISAWILIKEV